ncbi:MAG TPA: hypothetical protein VGI45_23775 [Terracidiphilus sp.]|jgi:hypothetical protein
MKRIVGLALLSLATLGVTIGAQAQEHAIIVNVPFEFAVGNKVLPTGTYTVTSHLPSYIKVESADRRLTAEITATQSHHDAGGSSKLVFNTYGNRYFLHRVLCANISSLNADLPNSSSEKRARSHAEEARLEPTETVLLASK